MKLLAFILSIAWFSAATSCRAYHWVREDNKLGGGEIHYEKSAFGSFERDYRRRSLESIWDHCDGTYTITEDSSGTSADVYERRIKKAPLEARPTPFLPPSDPFNGTLKHPHAKSKFLAVPRPQGRGGRFLRSVG